MEQRVYDIEKIHEALVNAFDDDGLTRMVYFRFHEHLSNIANETDNFRHRAFDLVLWAERENRLDELVEGAREANPNNPLLQNLLKQNGAAPSGTSGKAYLTKEGVAASSHDETAALVSRIAEWKNLHHSVQELLLVVFDTDRQMAKLKTPALSAKERTAAAEELDRMWMTDTSRKVGAAKVALSSFQLISREPAVVDLVEILTRTGDDSLARHLFGLNSGNRNELSRSSMLVMELQGILIDVLRASDEWIRELVSALCVRLNSGGLH